MKNIRIWVTRCLIVAARKTCVWGFTDDHLSEALKHERYWDG